MTVWTPGPLCPEAGVGAGPGDPCGGYHCGWCGPRNRMAVNRRPGLPRLPRDTVLVAEVGSTAHGTGIPGGEDHDETVVAVEPPEVVLGTGGGIRNTMHRTRGEGERSQPGDTDRNVYSLRSFCSLAAQGNPSVLLALWSPVMASTARGDELRGLAPAFVGRHVVPRYRGYLRAQTLRLLGLSGGGHGQRGGARRDEYAHLPYDGKYAMHAARLGVQGVQLLTDGRLSLPVPEPDRSWLLAVRRSEVPFEEWWARVLKLDRQLEALADYTRIHASPDLYRVHEWMVDTHLATWRTR